jgi:type IV pilus assembly protein PilE
MKKEVSGFTLVEMIVAVIILGIVASMTYVNYNFQRRKNELKAAMAQVQVIASAERLYYLNNRVFWATTSTANTNSRLGLHIQDTYFDNYRVNTGGGTFTIQVDGGAATYTFNNQGVRTGCAGADCIP